MTPRQRARCRHCPKDIYLEPDGKTWTDENGFPACVKGALKVPDFSGQHGGAIAYPPVLHMPMPAGFDGEPQPTESV